MKKEYKLGNCLRGYFGGEFKSIDDAWKYLSGRFNLSYPSENGRFAQMYIKESNQYGFEDWVLCKDGFTSMEPVNKSVVMRKCKEL